MYLFHIRQPVAPGDREGWGLYSIAEYKQLLCQCVLKSYLSASQFCQGDKGIWFVFT